MDISKYDSVSKAVEVTGYTDGWIRRLLRLEQVRGIKTGPRNWLIEKKEIERLKREREMDHNKSA